MNRIRIKLVVLALVVISLLVLFGGSAPILAESPNPAVPTVVLPTPAATKPATKPATGPTSPARVATRALVAPTATKAPAKVTNPRVAAARTSAQAFPSYTSSINLQNLSASAASISVAYFNLSDGLQSGAAYNDTVAANGSKAYFPIPGASTGFNGSAVISSNQPLASIVNVVGGNFLASASYDGSTAGNPTVAVPLLMKNNGGYYTWFNVQNAGSVDASVNVAYSDGTSAGPITIKAGASKQFNQFNETHSQAVFSAVVSNASTNQPLTVAVIEENANTMFAYNGFSSTGASTNPAMPLVNANNAGWVTGITVQNTGGSSTNVTLSYTPAGPGNGTACTETQTISAGQSKTFAFTAFSTAPLPAGTTTNCVRGAKFVGAAQATTNSASMPLSVIVNQLLPGQMGGAYGGFNPSAATNKVVLPLVMDRNSGWFTGINIANVGGATTVTCTFSGSAVTYSQALAAGAVFNKLTYNYLGNPYIGSGTCTGANAGDKLVGVVNELKSAAGDNLLVYEGINQ